MVPEDGKERKTKIILDSTNIRHGHKGNVLAKNSKPGVRVVRKGQLVGRNSHLNRSQHEQRFVIIQARPLPDGESGQEAKNSERARNSPAPVLGGHGFQYSGWDRPSLFCGLPSFVACFRGSWRRRRKTIVCAT